MESIQTIGAAISSELSKADTVDQSQNLLFDHLLELDKKIDNANMQAELLALGEAENLHQVMISISKAKTSFELTAEIRTKLLESFQQVMRMQV